MDHASDLKSDPEVAPHLDRVCEFLSAAEFSGADIRRAAGVIRTNAFGYTTKQGGEGAALFARISLMSHSCQ